jgi:hypothetical protein
MNLYFILTNIGGSLISLIILLSAMKRSKKAFSSLRNPLLIFFSMQFGYFFCTMILNFTSPIIMAREPKWLLYTSLLLFDYSYLGAISLMKVIDIGHIIFESKRYWIVMLGIACMFTFFDYEFTFSYNPIKISWLVEFALQCICASYLLIHLRKIYIQIQDSLLKIRIKYLWYGFFCTLICSNLIFMFFPPQIYFEFYENLIAISIIPSILGLLMIFKAFNISMKISDSKIKNILNYSSVSVEP